LILSEVFITALVENGLADIGLQAASPVQVNHLEAIHSAYPASEDFRGSFAEIAFLKIQEKPLIESLQSLKDTCSDQHGGPMNLFNRLDLSRRPIRLGLLWLIGFPKTVNQQVVADRRTKRRKECTDWLWLTILENQPGTNNSNLGIFLQALKTRLQKVVS